MLFFFCGRGGGCGAYISAALLICLPAFCTCRAVTMVVAVLCYIWSTACILLSVPLLPFHCVVRSCGPFSPSFLRCLPCLLLGGHFAVLPRCWVSMLPHLLYRTVPTHLFYICLPSTIHFSFCGKFYATASGSLLLLAFLAFRTTSLHFHSIALFLRSFISPAGCPSRIPHWVLLFSGRISFALMVLPEICSSLPYHQFRSNALHYTFTLSFLHFLPAIDVPFTIHLYMILFYLPFSTNKDLFILFGVLRCALLQATAPSFSSFLYVRSSAWTAGFWWRLFACWVPRLAPAWWRSPLLPLEFISVYRTGSHALPHSCSHHPRSA